MFPSIVQNSLISINLRATEKCGTHDIPGGEYWCTYVLSGATAFPTIALSPHLFEDLSPKTVGIYQQIKIPVHTGLLDVKGQ